MAPLSSGLASLSTSSDSTSSAVKSGAQPVGGGASPRTVCVTARNHTPRGTSETGTTGRAVATAAAAEAGAAAGPEAGAAAGAEGGPVVAGFAAAGVGAADTAAGRACAAGCVAAGNDDAAPAEEEDEAPEGAPEEDEGAPTVPVAAAGAGVEDCCWNLRSLLLFTSSAERGSLSLTGSAVSGAAAPSLPLFSPSPSFFPMRPNNQ